MYNPTASPTDKDVVLLSALAHASVVATLSLNLPGGASFVVERDTALLPSTGMTSVDDNLGRTWELLVDVDDLGEHALVVMDLRVSAGGRVIERSRPQLLVRLGESGGVVGGQSLPVQIEATAVRTKRSSIRALERSSFYDARSSVSRIRTWWPGARVQCWDPGVSWSNQDGWLSFDIARRVGPGQTHFTQCEVDGQDLNLYLYAH